MIGKLSKVLILSYVFDYIFITLKKIAKEMPKFFFCFWFQDLENTASSDAGVRERIASLPPEVSEVSLLANLADRTAADQLSVAVNEAAALLADYNGRLQAEMEDRRRLLAMLRDYTLAQKQLLQQAQTTLEVRYFQFSRKFIVCTHSARDFWSPHCRSQTLVEGQVSGVTLRHILYLLFVKS